MASLLDLLQTGGTTLGNPDLQDPIEQLKALLARQQGEPQGASAAPVDAMGSPSSFGSLSPPPATQPLPAPAPQAGYDPLARIGETAPKPPQSPALPTVGGLPLGEKIMSFLSGLSGEGGLKTMRGEDKARETENLTVKALMAKAPDMDADTARAIVRNPAMLASVLPNLYGSKSITTKPGEVVDVPDGRGGYRRVIDNNPKLVPFAEGGGLYDPATKQTVAGGQPKDPELVKDYRFYVDQETKAGRQPKAFEAWDLARKNAAATNINIDQKGELAFDQAAAKHQATRYDDIVKQGSTSREMIGDLKTLRDLSTQIETGKPAEILAALGPWAEALNVKLEGLGPAQAYQSIIDKLAPRMRVPGSGATSDFDARQFLRSLPQLGNNPQGNQVIADTFEAIQQSHLSASEIASRALAKEITPREAEKQLRALPDPYEAWKSARGNAPSGAPATPSTIEEALKLRPGAKFIIPDGPNKGKVGTR